MDHIIFTREWTTYKVSLWLLRLALLGIGNILDGELLDFLKEMSNVIAWSSIYTF